MKRCLLLAALLACAHGPRADSGEHWLSVTSDHFSLRTDLAESDARELSAWMERSRAVMLEVMWPKQPAPPGHMQVVAFASAAEVSALGPNADGFESDDPFGQPVVVIGGASERSRHLFTHELARALAGHFLPRMPSWLDEGVARYLETLRFDAGTGKARVGEPPDKDELRALQSMSSKYRGGVLAMGSEYAQGTAEEIGRFETASWVLVHYLVDERRDGLNAYAARLARGEDAQAAFDAQFPDLTEDGIQRAVHEYANGEGTFRIFEAPIPPPPPPPRIAPLPASEALALLASLYRPPNPQATQIALSADPLNPLALAVSGAGDAAASAKAHPDDWRAFVLLDMRTGNAKAMEKAALLAPDNPLVLARLANLRGKAGRTDEALALATQAASMQIGSVELDALAWALAGKRRCKEALRAEEHGLQVIPEHAPKEYRERWQARSIDLQSRCGANPAHVEMTEEAVPDTQPVRKSCGSAPDVSFNGALTADYLVREDGSVGDVSVTGKAAAGVLRAFEKFIASCRYQPATKDGKAVAYRMRQDLTR
jgi:hypothetical protein